MKIQLSKIQKITLADLKNLDPIGITLEDLSPGTGRITLTCSNLAWSRVWGSMGPTTTVAEFFCQASNDYLLEKLSRIDENLALLDRIVTTVKIGLDTIAAMEIAANPLPETPPFTQPQPTRSSGIEADKF